MKKPVLSGKYSRSAPKEAPNGLEIVRTAWNQFEIVLAGGTGFETLVRPNKKLRLGGTTVPLRRAKYLMRITEIIKPPTPDQARIKALSANKKRASDALKAERERQKRNKALQTLQGSYP